MRTEDSGGRTEYLQTSFKTACEGVHWQIPMLSNSNSATKTYFLRQQPGVGTWVHLNTPMAEAFTFGLTFLESLPWCLSGLSSTRPICSHFSQSGILPRVFCGVFLLHSSGPCQVQWLPSQQERKARLQGPGLTMRLCELSVTGQFFRLSWSILPALLKGNRALQLFFDFPNSSVL